LKISKPSIYKICKKLYQEEFLSGKTVRQGENPEKIIYTITKKGKNYFVSLMQHFSAKIPSFYFDFNCFIWNLEKLEQSQALEMLEKLQAELIEWRRWILLHEKEVSGAPFTIRMIVKQYRMTISTLAEWITETVNDFKKMNNIK
jgi:DNA-binding PadR family transcriptional regulator